MAYEERQEYAFEPDILISSEYEDALFRRVHREPEVRLMAAVLNDAIGCFEKYLPRRNPRSVRIFSETEEWFFGEQQDWLFSFENICDTLGLDPGYIRKGLIRLKTRILSQHANGIGHTGTGKGAPMGKNQGTKHLRVLPRANGSAFHFNSRPVSSKSLAIQRSLRKKIRRRA